MKDKDVSSLIVVDREGKPQGLITERDLVTKVCVMILLQVQLQISR